MPSRCEVKYCSGTSCDSCTYRFPKSEIAKQKWEMFVKKTYSSWKLALKGCLRIVCWFDQV